jgi:hypothetical protein
MERKFWMQELANLLEEVYTCDLFTDAEECREAIDSMQERARTWRELLMVESLAK